MTEKLRKMLEADEGRVAHAYQDHLGFWTIGVGRLIDKAKGGGLSNDEIDYLLNNDIQKCLAGIRGALPWFDTLNEARQAVLVAMAFQMGLNGLLGFRNTLAAVRDGRFEHAAELMLQSKWATQTPKRAQRMAHQMRTGEWQ